MSQRRKAREFLRSEGHGQHVDELTVKAGDKSELVHKHHNGRPGIAKAQTTFDEAEMGGDGLLRGHVKGV